MGSLEQAVYAIIISFVIGVILCPIVIPMLRKLIRDYKPFLSEGKQGRRGYHADDPVLWADRLSG